MLLKRLKNNWHRMRCWKYVFDASTYADDVLLLYRTAYAINTCMPVHVCEEYSEENNITFNASKSKFIVFEAYGVNLN